jgi:nitroreductase
MVALRMDLATVDRLLTTTRSVRKRLDLGRPVEPELIEKAIEIAFQAPTGSNAQGWHFIVVTEPETRRRLADVYRRGFADMAQVYQTGPVYDAADLRTRQFPGVYDSAAHLNEQLHEVPVLVVPCIEGRVENAGVAAQALRYGSILPAVWSFMLALRARGVGSAWTTDHLFHEAEVARLLGIPDTVTQVALLPVAYFLGADFKPARRLPARDRTHWNAWGVRR